MSTLSGSDRVGTRLTSTVANISAGKPKAVCNDIGPLLLTASCASVWRVPKLRALCLTANIAGWSNCTDYRSRFVVPHFPTWDPDTLAGSGKVMLGSYTPSTQGECDFCQDDPSALAPPREERRENIHRSREMQQFAAQLRDTKDPLEDLEPAERERKVAELRQKSCRRTNAVCNLCPHSSRYQTTLLAAMRNTSGYPRNWTRNWKGRRYFTPTSSTTCPARKSVASKS